MFYNVYINKATYTTFETKTIKCLSETISTQGLNWQIREQAGDDTQFARMLRVKCRWGDGLNSMRQGLWQAVTGLKVKEHVENLEVFPVSARTRENPCVMKGFPRSELQGAPKQTRDCC